MKKNRGEALIISLVIAAMGCVAVAWLEHFGVPIPTPAAHSTKKETQ